MNIGFKKIIQAQEHEDEQYLQNAEIFADKIKQEFSNAKELLKLMQSAPEAVKAFFENKTEPIQLSVLPVRKCNGFYIKKHTLAQRPYYHDHEFYEFIYVHKGQCIQKFLGETDDFIIPTKHAYLVCPGIKHALMPSGKNDVIFKIVIPIKIFSDNVLSVINESNLKSIYKITKEAEIIICKFLAESMKQQSYHMDAMVSYLRLLFIELMRTPLYSSSAIAERLTEYLNENLSSATLKDFSSLVGYNIDYVSRLIKRDTGESFSELLSKYRLEKSRALLETTDMSVEDIAAFVGYANSSGFYKSFYATYGVTPGTYRKTFN